MPCERFTFPGGARGIMCSRGPRSRAKCAHCGARATRECDFPSKRKSGTCDQHLCSRCAVHLSGDVDYCPDHPLAPQPKPAEQPPARREHQQLKLW